MVSAVERARSICAGVPDPELPVLTIGDLGILRDVRLDEDGGVEVVLTPTYSGCPATEVIRDSVRRALQAEGFASVDVRMALSPAWSTDDISVAGRSKLAGFGIAPPPAAAEDRTAAVRCTRCGSDQTVSVSRFGPTPCLAMYRCTNCLEPFDAVKPY
jgi:ring-1,2-phenylacetyl-CoA epoxidase subunit PaaD